MLIVADARHLPLADRSVQCVVTSPPYFGLRDYGSPHQIGLEDTPTAYVTNLVKAFAEVYRVLVPGGTVWLNLGDSYANDTKWGGQTSGKHALSLHGKTPLVRARRSLGLKSKDLIGIPWRVAFALQAAGWYLRSDIIWSKPNPMPESVTDRPTKAHEYLFLLSKSERYYYDAAVISEPYAESTLREVAEGYDGLGLKDYAAAGVQNPSDTKRRIIEGVRKRQDAGTTKRAAMDPGGKWMDGVACAGYGNGHGRNKRSVWTVATQPYSGAHFATFPEQLIEPCILAGCPVGGRVLDPFVGSGTVGAVAERLGRRWVGTDLSYQDLSTARTAQRGLRWESA